jgi:AraC-like DNA-binding protein
MISLILSAMTIAIVAFSLFLMCEQTRQSYNQQSHHYPSHNYPLMLALLCLGLLSTGTIVFTLVPNMIRIYIILLPVIIYALLPNIWLYYTAITSKDIWRPSRATIKHFMPILFAVMVSVSLALLPISEFNQMFFFEHDMKDPQAALTIYLFFAALITWCLLSFIYSFAIFRQTLIYRKNLNNMFANLDGKSVWWIEWLTILLVFTLFYCLVVMLFDNRFDTIFLSETGVFVLLLIVVWVLASNGLKQKPGFAEINEKAVLLTTDDSQKRGPPPEYNRYDEVSKYQRSALDAEHSKRIAKKIEHAIKVDNIYLDAALTLTELSRQLSVPSQYISQTLSQNMHTSFFDYINEARIKAAIPLLLEDKKSILDIAMYVGFNARSSFYKFFKRYTGVTPSEFKKQKIIHHKAKGRQRRRQTLG